MVYPADLICLSKRWNSRTERGPDSHSTCSISNSPAVGFGCLEAMVYQ